LCYVNGAGFICAAGQRRENMMKLDGKRILLVEDEYFIVQDLAAAFSAAGAVVLGPAATLSAALQLVASSGPLDGAVLDINLQGEMVFPLADVLMNRGVAFVFSTGCDRDVIPSRFDGCVRCEKPISPEQVVKALFG
jgi:DNA-binding response OmpR family regulator